MLKEIFRFHTFCPKSNAVTSNGCFLYITLKRYFFHQISNLSEIIFYWKILVSKTYLFGLCTFNWWIVMIEGSFQRTYFLTSLLQWKNKVVKKVFFCILGQGQSFLGVIFIYFISNQMWLFFFSELTTYSFSSNRHEEFVCAPYSYDNSFHFNMTENTECHLKRKKKILLFQVL